MSGVDEYGRRHPPALAGETETVLGFLDYQRATLAWKCRGLDAAGLQVSVAASTMTLGGLLKHMAYVEDCWFSLHLHDRPMGSPWESEKFDVDEDWDWHSAAEDSPAELTALWEERVERSRAAVAEVLDGGGSLDTVAKRTFGDDAGPNLRWILVHMIEEYARHNGHADLIREAIDGETGE